MLVPSVFLIFLPAFSPCILFVASLYQQCISEDHPYFLLVYLPHIGKFNLSSHNMVLPTNPTIQLIILIGLKKEWSVDH